MKIIRSGKYDQMLLNLTVEIELIEQIQKRVKLFEKNHDDTRLDNHSLGKKLTGKYAFSVTDDIRIVYEWIGKTTVRYLAIGPHKKVYT